MIGRGELACGNLANRSEVLELLGGLPAAPSATDPEALEFIERRALMGRGIGYIDVHLLASIALSGDVRLWTKDRRLAAVATELDLAFDAFVVETVRGRNRRRGKRSKVSSRRPSSRPS